MPDPADPVRSPDRRNRLAVVLVCAAIVLAFLTVAVPFMRTTRPTRAADDEARFHLPTIEQFAAAWPHPDLSNYPSATTPGYHLALALVRRHLGPSLFSLRYAGALFTVGLLLTIALDAGRRVRFTTALALCLPLVCSLYVLSSGIWLLPDNAGWWGVAAILILGFRRRVDALTWAAGGLVLLALVLVRQIHLWAAAVLAAAAWLGPDSTDSPDPLDSPARRDRLRRVILATVAVLPSVVVLAWFFHLWHGALPPSARGLNAGANPAVPAMVLAVVGVVGLFYTGFLAPQRTVLRRTWHVVAAGAVVGGLTALVPHTDYNQSAGRWSGLWNVAKVLPTVAHRSPLIVALAALGGAVLAAWAMALPCRDRWIFLAALVGFTAAHATTHEAYQRYYEPFALILFALAAARLPVGHRPPTWALAGPLALALLLAGVSAAALR